MGHERQAMVGNGGFARQRLRSCVRIILRFHGHDRRRPLLGRNHRPADAGRANAWNYWQFMDYGGSAPATIQNGSLMSNAARERCRQARFRSRPICQVRPPWRRADRCNPRTQSNVTVSAYQNTGTNTIKIILTNYSGSTVSQPVSITNAPTLLL